MSQYRETIMTPRAASRVSSQRGQATTELVVLALALVPLFIVIPLIGKYIGLMQATEAASRYVAFEGAVRNTSNSWKTDAELATEVRRRFFSNTDAPVKTDDTAGDFAANRNPLWTDHAGHPLLENFDTSVGAKGTASDLDAVPAMTPFRGFLDLPNNNFYTGSVTVKFADIPNFKPFDTIGLITTRKTVLLADAWTAGSAATVQSKIEGASAMYPITMISGLIDVMGLLPTLVYDPKLKVGDFDWDIVPCDRLVGGC